MPMHNNPGYILNRLLEKNSKPLYLGPDFFRFPSNPFLSNPFLKSSDYWAVISRHSFSKDGALKEKFCQNNEHIDPDIVQAFGGPRPPANSFLLHQARGNNFKTGRTPVLLIHGAGHNANIWADPFQNGGPGLAHFLVSRNYPVFAITFSHPHGDNYLQAEQLAEAIKQIVIITGKPRVDLVAHSKGGIPARMYLSNVKKQWGTTYRGDVRRIVMLGVPNRGLDYSFRKPLTNYLIYATRANGAISWDKMLYMGEVLDTTRYSLYKKGSFPGQCQLLYRWDKKYPLEISQPDWWTTYYGGEGIISHSSGINQAITDGGYLIELLEEAGIDKNVEISVLAGNKSDFAASFGIISDRSDGLLFVDSALHTDALAKRGARLLFKGEMPVNHLEFIYLPLVWKWIESQLES